MRMDLSYIALQLQAHLIGSSIEICSVGIDSRTLQKGALYIAIKGENFDGHDFIEQAEQAGAMALLVKHQVKSLLPQIVVKNTRIALAKLAGLWRQKSDATFFAITGSNGKTTVKEMLAAILSINANVLATQGNLNNQIGVPLTLLRLIEQHRYAVIEMGANHSKEIAFNSRFALANIGLINNVSDAHIEGFGSLKKIAIAKGEIVTGLKSSGIAILNLDDNFYHLWVKMTGNRAHHSFSLSNKDANVYASKIHSSIENNKFITTFNLHTATEKLTIHLNLVGNHNVSNALAAAAAALAVNIPLTQIQQGLAIVEPVTGRLQPWISRYGNIVIDDSYNANPASLNAALNVLKLCHGDSWLILGAFAELGDNSTEIHRQMGKLIREKGVKRLFTIGGDTRYSVNAFGTGALFFENQETLISTLKAELKGDEVLLIKGSRSQGMERIAAALIDNFRT